MKIPIKTFIDDMEKLLEAVFRPTDPASHYPEIANLANARVDILQIGCELVCQ